MLSCSLSPPFIGKLLEQFINILQHKAAVPARTQSISSQETLPAPAPDGIGMHIEQACHISCSERQIGYFYSFLAFTSVAYVQAYLFPPRAQFPADFTAAKTHFI
jgi:hypothetical protein